MVENSYAIYNLTVLDCAKVVIGDDVLIGPNVNIFTAAHPISPSQRKLGLEFAKDIEIGDGSWIGGATTINPGVKIGKNVFINACCKFQDQGGIEIGNGVLIGHNVTLATLNHDERPQFRQYIYPKPIKIGDNVWIGSNVTILQGITIGNGAIIGANAVVTHDNPENTVVAGVPAKIMRKVKE